MTTKTEIAWTEYTWGPIRGCRRTSPGCEHCYAETMAARIVRMGGLVWDPLSEHWVTTAKTDLHSGAYKTAFKYAPLVRMRGRSAQWTGKFAFDAYKLAEPLRWREPRLVFVNSMSDLFGEGLTNEQVAAVFGVMAAAPRHTFQVLTKRAERMAEWFQWLERGAEGAGGQPHALQCGVRAANFGADVDYCGLPETWPLPNVHLGVSCERQKEADERIPMLLRCPAAVHWVSAEPLLGPLDLREYLYGPKGLQWVVYGGESGHGARPCDIEWIRDGVKQCRGAGVPVFVKQLGYNPILRDRFDISDARFSLLDASDAGWTEHDGPPWLADKKGADMAEWPLDLRIREFPRGFVPPKSRTLRVVRDGA